MTEHQNVSNTLANFRSLAAEVRAGFSKMKEISGELRVVGGYLESKDALEAYRPLCIPVRRAYRETDRISFARVLRLLQEMSRHDLSERLTEVEAAYQGVRADLESSTILNGQPLSHRAVFDAWLDAAIFGSFAGKDREYRALLNECGKAVEGVAVRITEAIGERMLELDELVALYLSEVS